MDGLTDPGLIGREDSLSTLRGALLHAGAGSPGVVVVAGETGIGKTALVEQFLAQSDAAVLAGTCVPVAGEPLPYAALTQALRRASGTPVVDRELVRSPELARLLPGRPTEASGLADASSRVRLFGSVLALLERMGTERPVVHVVEDVHWADPATLDLLAFLATNISHERALLLLTYRTDVVADSSSLATWLAELGRLRSVELVRLGRLDRQRSAELVERLMNQAPSATLLASTLDRSAGNPLFIEQLVLAGDTPGRLPATLGDLLRARVAQLPEATRNLLRVAAVIGRIASVPLLARTAGCGAEAVEESLHAALAAHVLEMHVDDRVGFRHPAFGEVVYADLLPTERARLHRAVAAALEELADPTAQQVAELARHWHRAGDMTRALDAAERAGLVLERIRAFADAQASYTRALELLDQGAGDSRRDAPRRVWLSARAADCANLVGDTGAALRHGRSALAEMVGPVERAAGLERLATFHYLAGDGDAATQCFQASIELLGPEGDSVLAARVHAELGLMLAAWSRLTEAEEAAAEGLRIAHQVGARREEGVAQNALGVVLALRGEPAAALPRLRTAVSIALAVEDPHDVASAYVNLSHVLGLAGELDEVLDLAHEGIAALTRFGQDRQSGSLVLCNAADALLKAGRVQEASDLIAEALSREPRGITAAPVLLVAARVALVQGDLPAAGDRCSQARSVVEAESAPVGWLREAIETAAEVHAWAGRPRPGLDVVEDGLELIRDTDEQVLGGCLVAVGLRMLADDSAVRRDAESRSWRAARRAGLEVAWPRQSDEQATAISEAEAWHRTCAAELARLDEQPAVERWEAAATAWISLGRPFQAAYAQRREAEARLASGAGAAAVASVRTAYSSAVSVGAERLVAEIESMARWYRVDLLPQHGADAAIEDAGAGVVDTYGLTPREAEVLGALVAGQTNGEIAESMFISRKTASVHVSNILRKLDVASRQDAARIGHRMGVPAYNTRC